MKRVNDISCKRKDTLDDFEFYNSMLKYILTPIMLIVLIAFLSSGVLCFMNYYFEHDLSKIKYCSNCGYDLLAGGDK